MFGSWSNRPRARRTLRSRALSLATAAGLTLLVSPVMTVLTAAPARAATNPSGVQMTLEGCKRPSTAATCAYPTNFTTGDLGKLWSELDYVPHRLTLHNQSGPDQTFQIRLSADHLLNGTLGYDRFRSGWDTTFNAVAADMFTGDCVAGTGPDDTKVLATNVTSPKGVVGGVDYALTDELQIHLLQNQTCYVNFEVRLGVGSHLYSGSSLQTQVLNDDYSSTGQRTISLPVNQIEPQGVAAPASATHVTNYDWTVDKTTTSSPTLNSCLTYPDNSATVQYTVSYTKTASPSGTYHVSGTITLTNPSLLALTTATITDTVTNGSTDYPATIDYTTAVPAASGTHITVPAATSGGSGTATVDFSVDIPGPLSSPTNSATVTYQDPDDPSQTLAALTSTSTPLTIQINEQTGTGATASLSDSESFLSGSTGLEFERTSPSAMTSFAATNTFTKSLSDTDLTNGAGSFTIDKIVRPTAAENGTGTLRNVVTLTPSGQTALADKHADIPITVTAAKPTITIHKTVDIAPTSDATFVFSIANGDTKAVTSNVSVKILAGQTSGDSAPTTVDPSSTGYVITETSWPTQYGPSANVNADSLALCGSETTNVSDTRNMGRITVNKTRVGDPAGASTTFTFDVNCDGTAYDQTLTFDLSSQTSDSKTTGLIPTGTSCVITEGDHTSWTVTPSASQTATVGDTVSFTNTRDTGVITVDKSRVGDPTGASTTFTFHVDCPGTTYDQDLTFDLSSKTSDSKTTGQIPTGTVCSVTEGDHVGWVVTPSSGSQSATVGDTVSFTNTRDTGVITVDKSRVGDPTGAGTTFTFNVDCPGTAYDQKLTIDLSSNSSGSASTGQIPTGTVCTVTEGDHVGWTVTPSSGSQSATVGDTVSFTNTRDTGVVTINKTLVGDPTGAATSFNFHVDCPGTSYDEDLVLSVTNGSSGSITSDPIPTGLTCTVTEGSSPGWTETVDSSGGQVTVPGSVAFTNTRNTGVITVTKATSGAVAGASTVFKFDIVCPANAAYNQTLTIDTASANSATSSAIPTGLVCSVVEESTAGWQQTTPAQGGVDVTVPGTAAFTNTRLTGPLQLSKAVTPASGSYTVGDPSNTLNYTLSLSPTGALDHTGVVVTDYIPGYDPSDTKSGKTTYVTGSAACSTGCAASYDATQHLLTWTVGNVAHNASAILLTFKVTIDRPAFNSTVGLPSETIDNIGFVQSVQQSKTPSNQVKTPVTAVLGVKVVRPPVLAFTGLPAQVLLTVGLVMLGAGTILTSVRRREQ